jgi:hypothetical protein
LPKLFFIHFKTRGKAMLEPQDPQAPKPRTASKRLSTDQRLHDIGIALQNTTEDAVIKTELAEFGYTATKLAEGQALHAAAEALHRKQKEEYGEQLTATDALDTAREAANDLYLRHLKIARVAFKNDRGIQDKLDINGRRKETLSGWLGQAKQFYTTALNAPSIQASLATFGLTAAKLTAAQDLIQAVEEAAATQSREKGEAQEATRLRDLALEDLYEWISDFKTIARVALQDVPQQLEKLGVVMR